MIYHPSNLIQRKMITLHITYEQNKHWLQCVPQFLDGDFLNTKIASRTGYEEIETNTVNERHIHGVDTVNKRRNAVFFWIPSL